MRRVRLGMHCKVEKIGVPINSSLYELCSVDIAPLSLAKQYVKTFFVDIFFKLFKILKKTDQDIIIVVFSSPDDDY